MPKADRIEQPERADDPVDRIVAGWRRERPDLDTSAKQVTARVVWIAEDMHRRFDAEYARFGLKRAAYSTLLALRRAGAPHELTPTQITEQLFVTSGGLTPILDRLERDGLVERRPHPTDRRGVLVHLTADGRDLVDAVMDAHAAAETRMVARLTAGERAQLEKLLRKLDQSVRASGRSD